MEFTGVTYTGLSITDQETLDKLPNNFSDFFGQVNGIIAFNGGLHIRGCVNAPDWHSIKYYWTGEGALHKKYEELDEQDIPFGQDCLGDQFLLRNLTVHQLSGETGDLENLGLTFEQFISNAIEDPMNFLSLQPLQQFLNQGGHLTPGESLSVYPPFCTKESANGVSIKNVPTKERIDFLANFYQQLKDLGEGQQIQIKIN
ncbi:hypothetical protein [Zeaxanthinibacter enoshimensis]|nr:hypothetical protein [Zeaxanthinibacter enoshimensis]